MIWYCRTHPWSQSWAAPVVWVWAFWPKVLMPICHPILPQILQSSPCFLRKLVAFFFSSGHPFVSIKVSILPQALLVPSSGLPHYYAIFLSPKQNFILPVSMHYLLVKPQTISRHLIHPFWHVTITRICWKNLMIFFNKEVLTF